MKNIKLFACLLVIMSALKVTAREQPKLPLRVGMKMPEMVFNSMINYPAGKAKLSDFLGKPVILDLWSVGCAACIQGMPKMQNLQAKFGSKIQIIAVTADEKLAFEKLKKRSSIVKDITKMPFALGIDIKNLFDPPYYPIHVWIDEAGYIKAITDAGNASTENIKAFINNKKLDFIMLKPASASDKYFPIDWSLFSYTNSVALKKLKCYSLFTSRIDYQEANAGAYFRLGPKNPGVKRINQSLTDLIKYYIAKNPESKYVFESDELLKYLMPAPSSEAYDKWKQQYTYCYELSLPEGTTYTQDYINEYIKQDVQRFFKIKIEEKRQLTNCLILYRLDSTDRIKSKEISKSKDIDYGVNQGVKLINVPLFSVRAIIESRLSFGQIPVKVIDETGYKFNVNLKFNSKLKDVNLVREDLKKYGLGLKEEQREVDCIVVSQAY